MTYRYTTAEEREQILADNAHKMLVEERNLLEGDFLVFEDSATDEQISALKAELTDTDYMIIKAYEYTLVGLEVEYDIVALHAERQAIRDEINALEAVNKQGEQNE